jgi:hypothetical protein
MTIGVITLFGGSAEFVEACAPCVESVQEYCSTQNYPHFMWDGEGLDRPISWARIPMLLTIMEEHPEISHLLWVDADAMITNPKIRVEPLVDLLETRHRNILLSIDGANNLNDGIGLYKNCEKTKVLLSRLWDMEEFINHPWWVNAAISKLYATEPELRGEILLASEPNFFNSYVFGRTPWRLGDFIVHFAGIPTDQRRVLARAFREFTRSVKDFMPNPDLESRYYGLGL